MTAPFSAPRGRFITFEGGEGTGKSTQGRLLAERLRRFALEVEQTREPGGSPRAEAIRDFVLSGRAKAHGAFAEALLFCAARADHVRETIRPALVRGAWVISDRFADSTRAYQGALGNLDPKLIRALECVTVGETRPNLTLLLDLPAEQGLARARSRGGEGTPDRFEGEALEFHRDLRKAFLDIAGAEPRRIAVIDAGGDEGEVAERVWTAVRTRLPVPVRKEPVA